MDSTGVSVGYTENTQIDKKNYDNLTDLNTIKFFAKKSKNKAHRKASVGTLLDKDVAKIPQPKIQNNGHITKKGLKADVNVFGQKLPYQKILARKFDVERDLSKYSQVLKFESEEKRIYKVTLTALGKTLPGLSQRGKIL